MQVAAYRIDLAGRACMSAVMRKSLSLLVLALFAIAIVLTCGCERTSPEDDRNGRIANLKKEIRTNEWLIARMELKIQRIRATEDIELKEAALEMPEILEAMSSINPNYLNGKVASKAQEIADEIISVGQVIQRLSKENMALKQSLAREYLTIKPSYFEGIKRNN